MHSIGSASGAAPAGSLTPFVESIVRKDVKDMPHLDLNDPTIGHDYFTKAVTAATVSALRHQQVLSSAAASKVRPHSTGVAAMPVHHENDQHAGGHEGPSWDRKTSASVLLACTFLYAIIAGASSPLLVDPPHLARDVKTDRGPSFSRPDLAQRSSSTSSTSSSKGQA